MGKSHWTSNGRQRSRSAQGAYTDIERSSHSVGIENSMDRDTHHHMFFHHSEHDKALVNEHTNR